MNTKVCAYKNCGNISTTAALTFFSFPLKDAQKCENWAKLSGCEGINLKNKYLCEKHFNTIYISKTPRRTVLLPNAMPYSWEKSSTKDDHIEVSFTIDKNISEVDPLLETISVRDNDTVYDDEDIIYNNGGDSIAEEPQSIDNHEDIDENYRKIKMKSNKLLQLDGEMMALQNFDGTTHLNRISVEPASHVTKRQKLHASSDKTAITTVIVKTNKNKSNENLDDAVNGDENLIIDNTIDNPDIATFNFKGEEYIQMPKRIYLEQRAKLNANLKRFRSILKNIKSLVTDVN